MSGTTSGDIRRQLLEERGAEGKIVATESGEAESVCGMAEIVFEGRIGEEADRAENEVSVESHRPIQR